MMFEHLWAILTYLREASALSVRRRWAIPGPQQVGRATSTDLALLFYPLPNPLTRRSRSTHFATSMKKILLLTIAVLLALPAIARDFYYDGIWYTVLDEDAKTCSTKPDYAIDPSINDVRGDLDIPGEVSDGTDTYKLTTIGYNSFYRCNELTSVKIPDTVKEIEFHAFLDCKELTEVTIPASVRDITENPFDLCGKLTEFKVDQANPMYASLDGVLVTKGVNFYGIIAYPCGRPGEYAIPNSIINIETRAFAGCNLTSVVIPNSVTFLSDAFCNCESLTVVSIPGTVQVFANGVWSGSDNIKEVFYDAAVPVGMPDNSELFESKVHENATLYVRPSAIEAVRTTYPWNKFKNIVAYDFPIQDYYLVGDFNDWKNAEEKYKFTPSDNGDYVFDYEGILSEFKVTDGTWENTGVYGGATLSLNEINYLWRPGENLNFGDGVGVENPHIVFNPEKMTLVVTGTKVVMPTYYDIWGNFPDGDTNWSAIKMAEDDPYGRIWKAENIVVENECEFVLRFMVFGKPEYWIKPWGTTEITVPGRYECTTYDTGNFSIAPGKWNISFDTKEFELVIESATGAVDGIEADSQSAAPIYYNLQGVRVDNPAAGDLYIVVRGNKTTKEYVK